MRYKRTEKLKKQLKDDKIYWGKFSDLNLTDFMDKTRPLYMVWSCTINHIDCRRSWSVTQTYLGKCLQLDPYDAVRRQMKDKHELLQVRAIYYISVTLFWLKHFGKRYYWTYFGIPNFVDIPTLCDQFCGMKRYLAVIELCHHFFQPEWAKVRVHSEK